MSARRESLMRPVSSTLMTLTLTVSPTLTTSSTVSTRRGASCEMCTRPWDTKPSISAKAPKGLMVSTRASCIESTGGACGRAGARSRSRLEPRRYRCGLRLRLSRLGERRRRGGLRLSLRSRRLRSSRGERDRLRFSRGGDRDRLLELDDRDGMPARDLSPERRGGHQRTMPCVLSGVRFSP